MSNSACSVACDGSPGRLTILLFRSAWTWDVIFITCLLNYAATAAAGDAGNGRDTGMAAAEQGIV